VLLILYRFHFGLGGARSFYEEYIRAKSKKLQFIYSRNWPGYLAGNSVFIFGGKWMVDSIANSQQYLNWVIGGIFTVTASIQLIKILRHKDALSKFHDEDIRLNPDAQAITMM
jgi:hypothetical protein